LSAVLLNDAVPWWGNEIAVSSLDALITELYKEDKVTFEKTIKTIFSTVSDISVLKKSILERVAVENIELMLEVLELDKKKLIEPLLEQKRNPKGTLSRRLEYLEYIWLNDALPSWSDEMEVGNLDQLLNDLFYNHKDEFEKAIKKLLLTPSLTINRTLESLLSRFSVESISLFIQAIEPAMAGFIQTMVLVIERWTTRRRQIIAGTTDATRGGLWIVLHYLFSKKDTPFDTLALVEHTVRRLAENAKTDAATETKWLREIVVSAVTKNETRFMVVQQILDNPQFLSTPSPTETLAMQPDDWDTARQFDYFEYLVLNNALPWWSNKKNSPSLQNVYETLEKTAKIELEARLKRLFTESENNIETVVESLVERLDEAILQRILAHLEPDFIVFMQTVRLVLERWSAQQNLRIHAVIDNAKAPYALLFIYLLEKKTSAFDMAAALRSVINQLAAGRSISEKSIAQQWLDLVSVAVIAASEERFATIQQLLQRQLEDDIYFDIPMFMGDAPGEATWITEDTSATTPSILDTIYTTRQTLVWWEHFLNYGSLPGEVTLSLEQFVELLDELLQKLKGRTIQIARTLDFDRLVKNQLLGSLPSDFLQRWVHATMPTQSNVVWATYETYLLLIKNTPEKIVLSEQTLRQHLFIYSVRQREAGYSEFGYFTDLVRFTSRIQQVRGIEILEQLRSAVPVSDLTQTQATTFNATFQLAEKNLARALQQAPAALETTDTKTEDLSIGYKPQLEDVPIEILNAGLVLVWPFLPHLFTKLNLLTPEKKWISVEAQQRGVHLSQYLVSKQSSSPEFVLPLNKILCGMSINSPISKGIEMTEEEIEVCEGLLTAVTAQWSALKNTSPDGLRGAFLVRNGVLTKDGMNDGKWFLRVEKKPFDLLLQKLPWGMSMVRYTWSKNLVLVDWSSGVG
jgi:DNA-binding protein